MTRFFKRSEFRCKDGKCEYCGGLAPMAPVLIHILDRLRTECMTPFKISSGFRCVQHNINVGGSPNSYHMKGYAADVHPSDNLLWVQAEVARNSIVRKKCGLILYDWGFHLDIRGFDLFGKKVSYFSDRRVG